MMKIPIKKKKKVGRKLLRKKYTGISKSKALIEIIHREISGRESITIICTSASMIRDPVFRIPVQEKCRISRKLGLLTEETEITFRHFSRSEESHGERSLGKKKCSHEEKKKLDCILT